LLKYWLITERFYRESSERQWLQWWQQPNDGRKKQDLVKLDNLNNFQLGEVAVEFVILQQDIAQNQFFKVNKIKLVARYGTF